MEISEMCIGSDVESLNTQKSLKRKQSNYQLMDYSSFIDNGCIEPQSSNHFIHNNHILPPLQNIISAQDSIFNNSLVNSHEEYRLIRHIIDQCTAIYKHIGKYRIDPLRESERNQIIDKVFFTTEDMLKSLKYLERIKQSDASESASQIGDEPSISSNESTYNEYKMIRKARNLRKDNLPKYRRRSRNNMSGHRCHSCNTTDTPEWRRGPDGARTLCNACGLHYSKLLKKGSLTIQTHNYTFEYPNSLNHQNRKLKNL